MVQKELSLSKFTFLILLVFSFACNQPKNDKASNIFEIVDVSQIPNTAIWDNDSLLKLLNGVYYYGNKPYSGFIQSKYSTNTLKSIASYFQGQQHGVTKTFFPNGKLETQRNSKKL